MVAITIERWLEEEEEEEEDVGASQKLNLVINGYRRCMPNLSKRSFFFMNKQ